MPSGQQPHPIAIACADLHLSHKPPAARAGENWYSAMERAVEELIRLKLEHQVPVLCSGDVFHQWDSKPELINWAINNLPEMYAIPGQHDLPFHAYDDIRKSAYWTLVQAGTINHITSEGSCINGLWVQGFGWGREITPPKNNMGDLNIALVHEYLWLDNAKYTGAPEDQNIGAQAMKFKGYDTVIIGDNHMSWDSSRYPKNKPCYFNCGSLMRRNADQARHKPRVGIVMSDGSVKSHYLDISHDVLDVSSPDSDASPEGVGFTEVMEELKRLGGATLDFPALLRQAMEQRGTDPRVAKYLLEALEHGDPDKPKTR